MVGELAPVLFKRELNVSVCECAECYAVVFPDGSSVVGFGSYGSQGKSTEE